MKAFQNFAFAIFANYICILASANDICGITNVIFNVQETNAPYNELFRGTIRSNIESVVAETCEDLKYNYTEMSHEISDCVLGPLFQGTNNMFGANVTVTYQKYRSRNGSIDVAAIEQYLLSLDEITSVSVIKQPLETFECPNTTTYSVTQAVSSRDSVTQEVSSRDSVTQAVSSRDICGITNVIFNIQETNVGYNAALIGLYRSGFELIVAEACEEIKYNYTEMSHEISDCVLGPLFQSTNNMFGGNVTVTYQKYRSRNGSIDVAAIEQSLLSYDEIRSASVIKQPLETFECPSTTYSVTQAVSSRGLEGVTTEQPIDDCSIINFFVNIQKYHYGRSFTSSDVLLSLFEDMMTNICTILKSNFTDVAYNFNSCNLSSILNSTTNVFGFNFTLTYWKRESNAEIININDIQRIILNIQEVERAKVTLQNFPNDQCSGSTNPNKCNFIFFILVLKITHDVLENLQRRT